MLRTILPSLSRSIHSQSSNAATKLKSVPKETRAGLTEYRRKVSATRKTYFAETRANQEAAKEMERARKTEKKAEEVKMMSDPMLVGTYKPRRQLKRERQRFFGQFKPVPTVALKPPAIKPVPEPEFDQVDQIRQIYARDLTPENPRLLHLLHLWNSSEQFITPHNLDDKIQNFFNASKPQQPQTPVAETLRFLGADKIYQDEESDLTARIHKLMEFGVSETDVPYLGDFDYSQFAAEDKDTAPNLHTPKLTGGSLYEHALTRDSALRDKLTESFFGRPNVEKILEWGKLVDDPVQAVLAKTPKDGEMIVADK